jgi:ComF family protein
MSYDKILRFFTPRSCILCNAETNSGIDLCLNCYYELPHFQGGCERCGTILLPGSNVCSSCQVEPPPYERTIAVFEYRKPIDHLITSLKFAGNLACADVLGTLLAEKIRQAYQHLQLPEIMIPVPLHTTRLQERGFNQALEIAKFIGKWLHIPIDHSSCTRNKHTHPQTQLPAHERQKNVKAAFACKLPKNYQHVALVDDVVTTGHTVREMAALLLKSGVKKVDVWCVAKSHLHNQQ